MKMVAWSQLATRIPVALHRVFKIRCIELGIPMQRAIAEALALWMNENGRPPEDEPTADATELEE